MPPNNPNQPGLQQQLQNQLRQDQPQFGEIGVQGGQAGGQPPTPPPDNRNFLRKILDYLSRQRGIRDLPLTWNDTGPVSTSAGKTGQGGNPVGEFIGGTAGGYQQLENFTPEQIEALNAILGGSLQSLMNPYEGFQGLEDLARRNFYEQTIPDIFSQFNHATGGARLSSSPFGQQLGAAGAGLEAVLNAQRSDWGMRNRQIALQQFQLGLTPQFSWGSVPGQPGAAQHVVPKVTELGVNYLTGGGAAAAKAANTGVDLIRNR